MSLADDPWQLPSARAFLDEIERATRDRGGVVMTDASTPPDVGAAIVRRIQDGHVYHRLKVASDTSPLVTLSDELGMDPDVDAIAATETVAIIEPTRETQASWATLVGRLIRARADSDYGLQPFLLWTGDDPPPGDLPRIDWGGRLRRMDVAVWAELHAPLTRPEPIATLAAVLAVELCGWRLDLAAELASARMEDILDPLGWLEGRSDSSSDAIAQVNGAAMPCPLALAASGEVAALRTRVWRAQLSALFPWIEEQRQKVIARHRDRLRVDGRLRELGVTRVDDIEFGSLAYQLRGRVTPLEAGLVDGFAELRNDLAHRKPVRSETLERVLREAVRLDAG